MMTPVGAVIFLTFASPFLAMAQDANSAKAKIDSLIRVGVRDDIGRIDIFRLRDEFVNVVAVRPEAMERIWHYRMTIREPNLDTEDRIVGVLKTAKLSLSNREWDLRWGVVFYSRSMDKRITAIYFDRSGLHGSVEEIPVSFEPGFLSKLKKALPVTLD